ncbi:MAG TPA: DUF924 family protein [Burkholderiales bacterium]|nr:DUF924 family protein [Burkholderiales bacterium]
MPNHRAQDVLEFWFGIGADYGKRHKRWFEKDAAFDAEIAGRFLPLYEELAQSSAWLDDARSCLARIIVLDQFPRQMFRGKPRAFSSDPLALQAARLALERRYDEGRLPVERLFLYLPFEHSEALADQQRACELMRPLGDELYEYAVRHKAIIERFGRFPHRNSILGRESTAEEIEFLKQPGSSF